MLIQTVALNDVKCFAYHGFYAEEQFIGTYFMVNVSVSFTPSEDTENLQKTVNYEVLNQIILEEMKKTQKLLETVVNHILKSILQRYAFITSATVGIKKLNPPMEGEVTHSFVQLHYTV